MSMSSTREVLVCAFSFSENVRTVYQVSMFRNTHPPPHPQGLPHGYKASPPSATSTDYEFVRYQPEGKFEVWETQSRKSFTLINPLAPINGADWLSPHSLV